jgi:hypothetical protein
LPVSILPVLVLLLKKVSAESKKQYPHFKFFGPLRLF